MNPMLIKNLTAGARIEPRRQVKFGPTEGQVIQATGPGDVIVGVCIQPGGANTGDRVDVTLIGIADVEAGAAIAQGARVTSDGVGRAVPAAPAAGANANVAGFAYAPATAAGDITPVVLSPSTIQGA